MSWFWRGFQSAIFYYVSCAPCVKLSYQRKGRKAKKRALKESSMALNDMATTADNAPATYRPSPFSTNIFWREEMALGPGPPPRKGNRGASGSRISDRDRERELLTGGAGSSAGVESAASTLLAEGPAAEERECLSTESWTRRRYQRPDELLWGIDDEDNDHAGMLRTCRRSSAMIMTGTAEQSPAHHDTTSQPPVSSLPRASYFQARNPALNDLHPPVVSSLPAETSHARWMLQPPPSARIMQGKQRAKSQAGSRSVSQTSGRNDWQETEIERTRPKERKSRGKGSEMRQEIDGVRNQRKSEERSSESLPERRNRRRRRPSMLTEPVTEADARLDSNTESSDEGRTWGHVPPIIVSRSGRSSDSTPRRPSLVYAVSAGRKQTAGGSKGSSTMLAEVQLFSDERNRANVMPAEKDLRQRWSMDT